MSKDRTTEILNYLSAMAREFGEQRQELKEFRQEFNEFRAETNTRLERVDQRLDGMERQFKVFKIEQRQVERHLFGIFEAGITTKQKIDDLQDRVTLLEGEKT